MSFVWIIGAEFINTTCIGDEVTDAYLLKWRCVTKLLTGTAFGGSGGFPPRTRGTSVPRVQRSGGQHEDGTNAVSVVFVLSVAEFSLAAATRSGGQHEQGTNAVSVLFVLPAAEGLTERGCARQKTKRSCVFCLDHRSGVYKYDIHR